MTLIIVIVCLRHFGHCWSHFSVKIVASSNWAGEYENDRFRDAPWGIFETFKQISTPLMILIENVIFVWFTVISDTAGCLCVASNVIF